MSTIIFGDELDWRLSVLIKTMLIFNAIPVILLLSYIILSGIIIYSSALLMHLISFIFGLAIFAPIVLFSSLSALVVGFIIITSQQIFLKKSAQSLPSFAEYQKRLKVE